MNLGSRGALMRDTYRKYLKSTRAFNKVMDQVILKMPPAT
jgi:hypothetical protein